MYCNHRNSKNPGACKSCWRFGIICWFSTAVVLCIVEAILTEHYFPLFMYPLYLLYGAVFVAKWNKGD